MKAPISKWQQFTLWIKGIETRLSKEWPPELPPEQTPDFWFTVCKLEMATRDSLSGKLTSLAENKEFPPLTILESWFFRRRIEWAVQVALEKAAEGEPSEAPAEIIKWLLVKTWQSGGCIALWNHAERDGKLHPDDLKDIQASL